MKDNFHKKHISVVIVCLLFLTFSCVSSEESIRNKAIEHEFEGPVNNAICSFIEACYRMPGNLAELSAYCMQYDKEHSEELNFVDQFTAQMHGNTPWDYFSKPYVSFVSYEDSCFLYDRKHKYGCSVYGTPCFWANHDWRKARTYSPAFLNDKGEVITFDISDFLTELHRVTNLFENRVLRIENADSIPERFQSQSFCLAGTDTTAYNLVLKYSKAEGVVGLSSKKYYNGPVMAAGKGGVIESLNENLNLDSLSLPLRDSLSHHMEKLFYGNDSVNEVYFISPLVF